MQPLDALSDELLRTLKSAAAFYALSPEVLQELSRSASLAALEDGQELFADQDGADALCVVLEGWLVAAEQGDEAHEPVRRIGPGEALDRLQTLAGSAHEVHVRAEGPVRMACVPCEVLNELEARFPELRAAMGRLHRRQLLCRLHSVVGPLDAAFLDELERTADWVQLERGAMLFEQDADADSVYFVVSGRLRVERLDHDGTARAIGEAGRGESIGEMGFFTGSTRSARAVAVRDSVLVGFTHAEFDDLVSRRPQVLRHVARGLVERLQRAGDSGRPVGRVSTLAVLAGSPGAPVPAFCERLERALSAYGPVLRLSSMFVDAAMGEPGISQAWDDGPETARLLAWLEARESEHRFVVFETEPRVSPWTRRCLHQADRVVIVARADEDPGPGELERGLYNLQRRVSDARESLVLVHPAGTRHLPRGTRRWLDARSVDDHHHLRWDDADDMGRVARHLAGRAVGLVLGGGGARGFAHIGIVRALREAGIPIDMIGGTSMGASIAAQVAMGWSPEHITNVNRRVWIKIRPHRVYTLPVISIISTRKSDKVGKMLYGDVEIEDLWTPFFCVSSNLCTAEAMVHRRGSLLWAATASASLPGAAQPVLQDGQLLCDGALLNNLPGDVMRRLGCGTVIAAEVSVECDRSFTCDRIPRPGEIVRDRLFRRRRIKFPSLMELALRASMLHSASGEREVLGTADFTLRPAIDRFSLMGFDDLDAIVEVGYQHAREQTAAWAARAGAMERLGVTADNI